MNWCGNDLGGFGVLNSFTLLGDFRGSSVKPVYFREASRMTLLYTTRDFAGGETVRAARRAIRDLEKYLGDEAVREEHYQYQRRNCIRDVREGCIPPPVIRVNLDWLAEQLRNLQAVRGRCAAPYENHAHGVVYAVRFLQRDLPDLEYCSSMGIRCKAPIPPERIVAKARIIGCDYDSSEPANYDWFGEYRWRASLESSLIHALTNHTSQDAPQEIVSEIRTTAEFRIELDPAAGHDESAALGMEHGTAEIQEYFRRFGNSTAR
jgi:hypothetical protein